MFKNLKKKMEDVGADLATVSVPGTLGSSLSSLRRSESKTSGLSTSRESIHSQSSQSEPAQRVIRTSSVSSTEPLSSVGVLVPLPVVMEPENGTTPTPSSSFDALHIVDLTSSQSSLGLDMTNDIALTDFASGDIVDFSSEDLHSTHRSMSLVDEPVIDTSPVLVPITVEDIHAGHKVPSPSPLQQAVHDNLIKENESLKQQLGQKGSIEQKAREMITAKDMEIMRMRAEMDRYKEMVSKNRGMEERFHDAEARTSELTEQVNIMKLEQKSWKIAADDTSKQLKEKEASLHAMTRQVSDVEKRLASAKSVETQHKDEIDRYRQENASVKAAAAILERQIDQMLEDVQTERAIKETVQKDFQEFREHSAKELESLRATSQSEIELLMKQIRDRDEQHASELTNLRSMLADRESQLNHARQSLEEKSKTSEENYVRRVQEFEQKFLAKEGEINDMKNEKDKVIGELRNELEEKDTTIANLETRTTELETRIKALEEEVDSKDNTLAIIRRKSAKDMESKLRERDRQIASLERQVMELSDKITKVVMPKEKTSDETDVTSHAYMKNVVLKFVTGTVEEATQLIRAISVLFKLSPEEETWVREVLIWKNSWLPAAKPELHRTPSSSSHNGSS